MHVIAKGFKQYNCTSTLLKFTWRIFWFQVKQKKEKGEKRKEGQDQRGRRRKEESWPTVDLPEWESPGWSQGRWKGNGDKETTVLGVGSRWCHLLGMLWLSFDHTMLGEEVGTWGPGWKWGEKRTLVGQFYKQDCFSWLFRTLDRPCVIKCFAMDCLVKSFCNGKLKNWNSLELLYSKQIIIMLGIEIYLSLSEIQRMFSLVFRVTLLCLIQVYIPSASHSHWHIAGAQ